MTMFRRLMTLSLAYQLTLVVAMAVTMAGILVMTGTTFGLMSASAVSSSSSVSSGSVSLTSAAGGTCATTALLPGVSAPACTLSSTYSGTASAFLSLDVLIETQAGNGASALYNPSDAGHALQVSITSTSPAVTFVVPTVATTCPGSAPTGSTCYALNDELIATSVFTSASPTTIISTVLSLPQGSTAGYRGGAAQIIESVHATQATNNGSTATCTAGHQCDATSPGAAAPLWN